MLKLKFYKQYRKENEYLNNEEADERELLLNPLRFSWYPLE